MKVFISLISTVTDESRAIDALPPCKAVGMLKKSGSLLRLSFPLNGQMQTLCFDPDLRTQLELRRENGFLLFDSTAAKTEGLYKLEQLCLTPTVCTHRLANGLTENGGELTLDSTLDFEGEKQHFHMEIEVNPAP